MSDAACTQVTPRRARADAARPQLLLLCACFLACLVGPVPSAAQQVDAPRLPVERIQADDLRVITPQPNIRGPGRRGDFPMPDVIGLTVDEARERVVAAGRNAGATSARAVVEYREDRSPAGRIIAQAQQPGQAMRPYRDDAGGVYGQVTFNVTVSRGMERAPSFLGMSIEDARREAAAARIRLAVAPPVDDPTTRPGVVVRQDPAPEAPMQRRRVTVSTSAGYPLPDFRQRPLDEVTLEARKLEIDLRTSPEERPDVAEGIVFAQRPAPGTRLPLRGPVELRVSRGSSLPRLVGLSLREAGAIAERLGLELRPRRIAMRDRPRDEVAEQSPPPGARLPLSGPVLVTVSDGWETPDLLGLDEAEARARARREDITLVSLAPREDYDVDAGRVIDQRPLPRAPLPANGTVQVTLSLGWPVAPDAIGASAGDIARGFRARHPSARVIVEEENFSVEAAGRVIAQRPAAGSKLPRDQRLVLVVAGEKPPWLWAGAALVILVGATTLILILRPKARPSPRPADREAGGPAGADDPGSDFAEEPSGVRLRLRRDLGRQSIHMIDGDGREHAAADDGIHLELVTDSGRQTLTPLDDGEEA